ncbi:glycine oxidase ThiO [Alicyclobacillus fodiniaquatilis]|uniref:glycine oxidase n=1 Tax=Alicyclobacillus fodiniaquatilis TaxID=1661150 RepID=A0ABW4JEG3_9BACL
MAHRSTALIIGGGVIGGAIAWELTKLGMDCTIVDKGAFSAEASTASAGMLCPQAEILDNPNHAELFKQSQDLHRAWTEELEASSHIPVQYMQKGMLRVVLGAQEEASAKALVPSAKTALEWLDAKDVLALESDVTADVRGGIYFPEDGQLHPIYLAKSLYTALQQKGCQIKEWTPVLNLLLEGERVLGARTTDGDYFADYTIVAAGAWSSSLLAPLGFHMPVHPVKGQMYAVRYASMSLQHIVQGPGGMIIPRLDGTFTVGVTHEEVGYDKRHTVEAVTQVHQRVKQFIPKLQEAIFVKTWAGLRPGTPDGFPYIGDISGMEGVFVASGHYTIGILLAPITGKLIGQLMTKERPCIDTAPFRPDRFKTAVTL